MSIDATSGVLFVIAEEKIIFIQIFIKVISLRAMCE